METNEHKNAGDLIRIETFNNPYFQGSIHLSESEENTLKLQMMRTVDGIPVPLPTLHLTAGDVVALAGDYYTKAGWGMDLKTPDPNLHPVDQTDQLLSTKVSKKETLAFHEAYGNLACPEIKNQDIQRIYSIVNNKWMPSLLKELYYTLTVNHYGKNLNANEAHFSPWSVRAYQVGHQSALRMASFAYTCQQMAHNQALSETHSAEQKLIDKHLETIKSNPSQYHFDDVQRFGTGETLNASAVLEELSHRYHALAVAQDLFAMHFYSDHFAGGHLSRIGLLRKTMPEKFGALGSILINNMHNEDNTFSITVTDPFQPDRDAPHESNDRPFRMIREDNAAYGDGTYFKRENNENSNMLINGMDNSLGDIARLLQTGEIRQPKDYGGLAFMPSIDASKPQPQPLLVHGPDNSVYVRRNLSEVNMLSPEEYQSMLNDPQQNGYEKLTYFKSLLTVVKLRVLGFIYAPKETSPPHCASMINESELTNEGSLETMGKKLGSPLPKQVISPPAAAPQMASSTTISEKSEHTVETEEWQPATMLA